MLGVESWSKISAENAVIKIKSNSKVTVQWSGVLEIVAHAKNAIKAGWVDDNNVCGNSGYAYLIIDWPTLNINSTDVYRPNKGDTYGDWINVENYLWIKSWILNIVAGDDGIHSDCGLDIWEKSGGVENPYINVTKSAEAIEWANINIYAGYIRVNSDDDAINAANNDLSSYQFSINIFDGYIYAVWGDDSIDSNWTIKIYSWTVLAFGGTRWDSSAFDVGTDGNNEINDTFAIYSWEVFWVGQLGPNGGLIPVSGSQYRVSWGSKKVATNLNDVLDIALKFRDNTYSVWSNINIYSWSDIEILNYVAPIFSGVVHNSANWILYSSHKLAPTTVKNVLSYDSNGGSWFVNSTIVRSGESVLVASNKFIKTGYTFISWNTSPNWDGTEYFESGSIKVVDNVTLYAQWKINTYSVMFDTKWWNSVDSMTWNYWSIISAPINPTRNWYTFLSWDKTFPIVLTGDVVVTALWKLVSVWWWGGWWWGSASSKKDSNTGSVLSWSIGTGIVHSGSTLDSLDFTGSDLIENRDSAIAETDLLSWYMEWDQTEILYNWFTREFNNAYKFSYINKITTTPTIYSAGMKDKLTRIAMAKMLSQYAINVLWRKVDSSKECDFYDISGELDSQYNSWVSLACQLWIMWINISAFRPYDNVTRAEFGTALSRMLFWLEDWYPYYLPHLAKLKEEWIITVDVPNLIEIRWYVMLMLMRSTLL